jgi:hypothetical protein
MTQNSPAKKNSVAARWMNTWRRSYASIVSPLQSSSGKTGQSTPRFRAASNSSIKTKYHITLRSFGRTIAEFNADLSEREALDLEESINCSDRFRAWIFPVEAEPEPMGVLSVVGPGFDLLAQLGQFLRQFSKVL